MKKFIIIVVNLKISWDGSYCDLQKEKRQMTYITWNRFWRKTTQLSLLNTEKWNISTYSVTKRLTVRKKWGEWLWDVCVEFPGICETKFGWETQHVPVIVCIKFLRFGVVEKWLYVSLPAPCPAVFAIDFYSISSSSFSCTTFHWK